MARQREPLLAEATLQAVLSLPDVPERQEILTKMESTWKANAPNVDALAAAMTPQLTECALDLALDRWSKAATGQNRRPEGQEATLEPMPLNVGTLPESVTSGPEAAFVTGLLGHTRPLAGEEGMFDWLGPVLKTAVAVAKPLVSQVAKTAVTTIAPKLINKVVGAIGGRAESGESAEAMPALSAKVSQVQVLLKRAVMADAALQAVMSMSKAKLDRLRVNGQSAESEAEGIFDFIKTAVQKAGPVVLDTAKKAAKTFAPVVLKAVADKVSGSTGSTGSTGGTGGPAAPGIKRGASLLDDLLGGAAAGVLNGARAAVEVSHVQPMVVSSRMAESVSLDAMLATREREWRPSMERRPSWDSNDDAPVLMDTPPPEF